MKNIPSNQRCFEVSQKNQEPALDEFYIFEKKNDDIEKYINNTKEIKNYLITIKTLLAKNENEAIIDKYFTLLAGCLNNFSNCSEFSCFINACDNILDYTKKDFQLLKEITIKYLANRTLNENVPEEWIQAILDSNASRKKGSCGENKLLYLLSRKGYATINSWEEFNKYSKCAAKFSKYFDLKNVRKNLQINIKTKKQNKKLDLIIKRNGRIFLLEAKHLNTNGGEQDKQISELIELLTLAEINKNISYIAFLDGNYSNILLSNGNAGDKLKRQRKEIMKYLKKNSNNYFINTAGFNALF